MVLDKLKEFLIKYDESHNLQFNNLIYRPGARTISGFGIGKMESSGNIQIQSGTVSSWSAESGYDFFSPFDCFVELEDEYLLLKTEYGFHLRLSIVGASDLTAESLDCISTSSPLKRNSLVGTCHNATPIGKRLFLEVISDTENPSDLLLDLLREKYGHDIYSAMSEDCISSFFEINGIDEMVGREFYNFELLGKEIEFYNNFYMIKKDPLSNERRYFFNSLPLFGF